MMPLACLGSPQDTLTEVVVNSPKWMKPGALGALGEGRERTEMTVGLLHRNETRKHTEYSKRRRVEASMKL